jgi:hypothetical protein
VSVEDGWMPVETAPRQIRFNAFDMNCVAHQSSGMWRHPDDQAWRYKDLTYWTELAKLLERGTFDGIFIADVLGTYDVYGASNEAAIRHGAQVPVNDPVLLVSAMALVTDNLPTSTSRCSISCGKARGKTTRCCAIARPASSPIPRRCTR